MTGGRHVSPVGRPAFDLDEAVAAHVLPPDEFRLVRTDRNREQVTRAEQETLLDMTIAVVGLSAGNSPALTCAMEGV